MYHICKQSFSSNLQVWFWRRQTLRHCSAGPADCRRERRCGKLWTAAGRRSAVHAPSQIVQWTQTHAPLAPGLRCCCYQRLGEEGQCCCWWTAGCGGDEWSWRCQTDLYGDDLVAWMRENDSVDARGVGGRDGWKREEKGVCNIPQHNQVIFVSSKESTKKLSFGSLVHTVV